MSAAKEAKETAPTFKEIAAKWAKAKESVKNKYADYAEEDKEERAKKRDLYEIAFNVKPRRPLGAFKFFLMEQAKLGKLNGNPLVEGHKQWKKLADSEKEKYERIAQRDKLAYLVKKMEYEAEMKKSSTYKAMSPFNVYCSEFKGKIVEGKFEGKEIGKGGFFDFAYKKWQKLDDATKRKYVKKSDEDKVEAARMKEEFQARVYNMPKRPGNFYTIFIQAAVPELKAKNPKKEQSEIFKMASEQWKTMSDKQKDKYSRMYEKVAESYKRDVKSFADKGYYTPDKSHHEETPKGRSNAKKSSESRSNSTAKRGKKAIKD
jgi:hypothetical protein